MFFTSTYKWSGHKIHWKCCQD